MQLFSLVSCLPCFYALIKTILGTCHVGRVLSWCDMNLCARLDVNMFVVRHPAYAMLFALVLGC